MEKINYWNVKYEEIGKNTITRAKNKIMKAMKKHLKNIFNQRWVLNENRKITCTVESIKSVS